MQAYFSLVSNSLNASKEASWKCRFTENVELYGKGGLEFGTGRVIGSHHSSHSPKKVPQLFRPWNPNRYRKEELTARLSISKM